MNLRFQRKWVRGRYINVDHIEKERWGSSPGRC